MQMIPVIDLKDGMVVHARQGKRDAYRPIHTALCRSPDIFAVIEAYLSLYDFSTFYIADLNALEHRGHHDELIDKAARHFSRKIFWLDQGFRIPDACRRDNIRTVWGSESFQDNTVENIASCRNDFILSLDYSATGSLGANCLFANPDYWPNDIIIMTLQRVGSDAGPDMEKLAGFRRNHPEKNFIAAGGVRNKDDLLALRQIGIRQVLVASALHSGAIGRAVLAEL
ncbi:MAG: HisA/HisF-related TIM barrel protein [Gammaproteobacteria bacterium]